MFPVLTHLVVLTAGISGLCAATRAQPSSPNGTCNDAPKIESKVFPGASISYQRVSSFTPHAHCMFFAAYTDVSQTNICETTPGVRAFSGYVNIPSTVLDGSGGATPYNASMFFWYFESRKDPKNAPLSLYLGGGPGTTSLLGVTEENGPCYINPDSNSTTLNPWSWNNNVNMLYIDQPVQVGFSYDKLIPTMLDLLSGTIIPSNGSATSEATSVTGILPSQDPFSAANTTANAARVLWQFAQIWLQDFSEHESSDARISIWANSVSLHTISRLLPLT
jgi:hypothetical protein